MAIRAAFLANCALRSQLAGRLFGVTMEAADGQAPVWHEDVRFFKVLLDGKPKAFFYLDPYSRPAGVPLSAPSQSPCSG